VFSLYLESSLPAPLLDWLNAELEKDLATYEIILFVLAIPAVICSIAGFIGLFLLKRWGAWFYVSSLIIGFIILPFTGPTVEHAIADTIDEIAVLLSGMIIGLAFFSDALDWGRKDSLQEETNSTAEFTNEPVREEPGMGTVYPSILQRYLSSALDGILILCFFIGLSYVFQQDTQMSDSIRIAIFLSVFLCYEPICVSLFCTLGQRITGIRVRRLGTGDKIPLPHAFIRYFLKVMLGFISLFAIIFSERRRAIHDYASGSIVLLANDEGL
jgi:uncharacterized RDD family membrane protein YckC